jgi:hypothetical protein
MTDRSRLNRIGEEKALPLSKNSRYDRSQVWEQVKEIGGAGIRKGEAFRRQLEPLGVVPTFLGRVKFSEFQHAELAKWAKAVREGGVRID